MKRFEQKRLVRVLTGAAPTNTVVSPGGADSVPASEGQVATGMKCLDLIVRFFSRGGSEGMGGLPGDTG